MEPTKRRVKHTASGQPFVPKKPVKGSGSSNPIAQEEEHVEVDPYYTPQLQAARIAKYSTRIPTAIRYVDMVWFASEGFDFPRLLARQGVTDFLELKGAIYPNLVKEFYANFKHKDDICMSMIKGKSFEMNKDIFMNVGSLACDGARIGDCENVAWKRFDANAVYVSLLRNPELYVQGTTKKAGLFTVEQRLVHYLIVYLLVPRLLNLAQPTSRDLQMMYAIKRRILLDWPSEILRHMYLIAESKNKPLPLAYSIFISRIVDYLEIDTSSEVIDDVPKSENMVNDKMLHTMFMIKTQEGWIYEDERMENIDEMLVDSGNEEDEQPNDENQEAQGTAANAFSVPAISVAYLDAMEQRMNARMDERLQGMENRIMEAIRLQTEELKEQYSRMHF